MTQRASDHLANERTFLAWVRTSLGLIGLGFVLARMGLFLRQFGATLAAPGALTRDAHAGHEFLLTGVAFLVSGTALGGYSGWLYARNRRALDADQFVPAAGAVLTLTAVVVLGGLVIVALVLGNVLGGGV